MQLARVRIRDPVQRTCMMVMAIRSNAASISSITVLASCGAHGSYAYKEAAWHKRGPSEQVLGFTSPVPQPVFGNTNHSIQAPG